MAVGTFHFNKKCWCLCVYITGTFTLETIDIFTPNTHLALYLVWKVERGSLSSISAMDAHEERHRSVQQVMQWCRNNGQVDVLPLEWE